MKIRGNINYRSNQGKLADDKFALLPLGAVKAKGFIKTQLNLQKDGITGAMENYPDYDKTSAWRGGNGEDWERGPYYMRGLVALAYLLEDSELIKKAQVWIESVLGSQRVDGFFGPESNTDWWPRMPVLMALRDYYEATGDSRVIPFMRAYFEYQCKHLPEQPLDSWAHARGGDNIDSVYWLYNRLYDANSPEATDWLLELAALLKSQTQDWTHLFTNTTVREHVVNTSQAMKTPAVCYQGTHSQADRDALKKGLFNISIDHGRIDELPNSDEAARDNRSTRGSETCGVVEGMLSTEIAMRILGEGWLGDRLETLAYNALPAAYSYDYKSHVYYILQNQVLATRGDHGFDCDHGDSSAFGAPDGFDCCFANNHMGWPKFVQSMWMATREGGLAAVCYGPNTVCAKVADGKTACFVQTTDYPFDDVIKLEYSGECAGFELKLRVPDWCKNYVILINDQIIDCEIEDGFATVVRVWSDGDTVTLEFKSEITTSAWYNNSIAVQKGALIYSLKIDEQWRDASSDNSARELKVPVLGGLKNSEVYPVSRWNYGLDENAEFEVEKKTVDGNPFVPENAPIVLKTKGQIIDSWKLDGNIAADQPVITAPDSDNQQCITLVPYGSTRLKITHFPRIGEIKNTVVRNDPTVCQNAYEFKNVIVPDAAEYDIRIDGKGEMAVTVNGQARYSLNTSNMVITGVKSAISDRSMQFNAEHYNHILIESNLPVNGIEIIPHPHKLCVSAETAFETIQLTYNKIQGATEYAIEYTADGCTDRIDSVKFNPYKGSEFFEADKTAFTAEAGKTYELKMIAYRGKTEICRSENITVSL